MSWTYLELPNIPLIKKEIQTELNDQLKQARGDSASQKALNEKKDWRDFLQALEEFKALGRDPASFLPVLREFRSVTPKFYRVQKKPFNLIYRRDPVTRTATALSIFHDRDKLADFSETFERLVPRR